MVSGSWSRRKERPPAGLASHLGGETTTLESERGNGPVQPHRARAAGHRRVVSRGDAGLCGQPLQALPPTAVVPQAKLAFLLSIRARTRRAADGQLPCVPGAARITARCTGRRPPMRRESDSRSSRRPSTSIRRQGHPTDAGIGSAVDERAGLLPPVGPERTPHLMQKYLVVRWPCNVHRPRATRASSSVRDPTNYRCVSRPAAIAAFKRESKPPSAPSARARWASASPYAHPRRPIHTASCR